MPLEKPIQTIRKAIKGTAENAAEKESLEKPTSRHFEQTLSLYKQIRDESPEMLEKLITVTAKAKELKDELGPSLDRTFRKVWSELNEKYKNEIITKVEKLEDENLISQEYKRKLVTITGKIFNKISEEFRNDPRIIVAFTEKEELLEKAITFSTSGALELFDIPGLV